MDTRYFSLSLNEDNRFVKVIRIIFGSVCIVLAISWIIINSVTMQPLLKNPVVIVFLTGFGFYQIWMGSGKGSRFIEIRPGLMRLKKNSLLPVETLVPGDIEKIEIFPLSMIFNMKPGKKVKLRFGTINYETNEKIVDEVISFAEKNNIEYEVREEEI